MRTTLTLDDDLAGLLKEKAARQGISFKVVVNNTIREALGHEAATSRPKAPKTLPHAFGFRPGVDLDKLNQLADDLEVEELARKQGRPR